MSSSPRRGLTLVELTITMSMVGVTFFVLSAFLRASTGFYRLSSTSMNTEGLGSRAVHEIADALRGARLDSIAGLPEAPLCDAALLFETTEPYDGKSSATSAPIWITANAGELVRSDAFLLPAERRTTLLKGVPELFEGETLNGLDDNGNGFVDEPGLFFAREGSTIVLGLTLEAGDLTRSWTTRVVCRN